MGEVGVTREFVDAHPKGVSWACDDVCPGSLSGASNSTWASAAAGSAWSTEQLLCLTCSGAPPGHPECLTLPWRQRYPNMLVGMWFVLVLVTPAVALDPETYPSTPAAQTMLSLMLIGGVLFLAMPLSIVGSNFQQVWRERHLVRVRGLIRQLLLENDLSVHDCQRIFLQVDADKDGVIDFHEFSDFLTSKLGLRVSGAQMREFWQLLDEDGSGILDFYEFARAVFPEHPFAMDEQPKARNADLNTLVEQLEQMRRLHEATHEKLNALAERQVQSDARLERLLDESRGRGVGMGVGADGARDDGGGTRGTAADDDPPAAPAEWLMSRLRA
jgi:hypothetical protein